MRFQDHSVIPVPKIYDWFPGTTRTARGTICCSSTGIANRAREVNFGDPPMGGVSRKHGIWIIGIRRACSTAVQREVFS